MPAGDLKQVFGCHIANLGGQKFPPFKQFNSPLFNKFGKFATSWKTFDLSAHSKRKYMSVHYRNFRAETTEKGIHDS